MGSNRRSGSLRAPLDDILGTGANVQILRVLTRQKSPLGRAETARRAGITPQGGRKAIDRLFEVGIVEFIGSGNVTQVKLRWEHPLASAIEQLFIAEEERFIGLIHSIRSQVNKLQRPPRAVWVQGPVTEGTDEYGDPLILGVLAQLREVDSLSEMLRNALVDVERQYDVTIDVRPHTEADLLETMNEDETTIPILGPDPGAFINDGEIPDRSSIQLHRDYDDRTLNRSSRLAELLAREPGLRDRALQWVEERLQQEDAGNDSDMREWKRILESTSMPRLQRFLTSDTERAVRLRQSNPFWSVLTEKERDKIVAGNGE